MSISDQCLSVLSLILSYSDSIHISALERLGGMDPGDLNWLANLATLNILVSTPKYFDSISSGLMWKSSPTWASAAFQSLKHSDPILLALSLTDFPSGPLICHEPVLPPRPQSRTESASIPLRQVLTISFPCGLNAGGKALMKLESSPPYPETNRFEFEESIQVSKTLPSPTSSPRSRFSYFPSSSLVDRFIATEPGGGFSHHGLT